jgi:hypothetical protein
MRWRLIDMPSSLALYWGAIARAGILIVGMPRDAGENLAVNAVKTGPSDGLTPCKVSLALSDVRSVRIKSFDGYWQSVRGDRDFPAKRDINPAEIKAGLPYINIAEIYEKPLRVRYRLVGTELCRIYNEDYTGRWLHETHWGPLVGQYERIYRTILERRTPMFGIGQIEWEGRIITCEWGKWPLSEDGGAITHCLGMADYTHIPSSDPEMALGRH